MKIEELLSQIITPRTAEAQPAAGEANFAQHLKEALAADPKAGAAVQAPANLAQLAGINPVSEVKSTPGQILDEVLSRLDVYREALAQADVPLKKIANLVQLLEADSERLQTLAQDLPGNSPLKQMLEEAAALAYTESFKFNRGDYV